MLTISSLADIPVAAIAAVFNESFAGYTVPMQLTPDGLRLKIQTEHIDLQCSVGVFDGTQLVSFMLIATGEIYGCPALYNAGTGVLPSCRGQKLTERMYAYLVQRFGRTRLQLLEVITTNQPAIKAYTNAGMEPRRTFNCFKGNCIATPAEGIVLQKRQVMPVFDPLHFWDDEPSWQNSTAAIMRAPKEHDIYIVTNGGRLLGYIVFSHTGRIRQLAVHKDQRRQGIGTTLLYAACKAMPGKELAAINADSRNEGLTAFFQSNGLQLFLQQYEMSMG